jgi:hypothetical protein
MASTTDMAPNRTTKAPARRAANGPRRSAARSREDDLSEQVHQLQTDLKSIAATLAGLAEDKVSDAQRLAKREVLRLALGSASWRSRSRTPSARSR